MGYALHHMKMSPLEFEELWNSGLFSVYHLTAINAAMVDEKQAMDGIYAKPRQANIQDAMRKIYEEE